MRQHTLRALQLACAILISSSVFWGGQVQAQISCPAASGDHPTAATGLITSTATSCSTGTSTDAQYDDPTTLPSGTGFALFLPGTGSRSAASNNPVKVFARDAGGAALHVNAIVCEIHPTGALPYAAATSGIATPVATIALDNGEACYLTVAFASDQVSFVSGLLSRTGDVYTIDQGQLVGGQFGVVAPTIIGMNGTDLERNGVVLAQQIDTGITSNTGFVDQQGRQVVGTPVTLTYTFTNTSDLVSNIGPIQLVMVSGGNVQSLSIVPFEASLGLTDQSYEREIRVGQSIEYEVTYIPVHATDFEFTIEIQINDVLFNLTVRGPGSDPDDPPTERTERIIENFITRRGGQIMSKEPDLTKRLGRRMPRRSLKDAPPLKLGGPVTLTGEGTEHNNRLAFSTSLGQVVGSMHAARQRRVGDIAKARAALAARSNHDPAGSPDTPGTTRSSNAQPPNAKTSNAQSSNAMNLGYGGHRSRGHDDPGGYGDDGGYGQPQTGFGLWAEGTWARIDDGTTDSDFGLLYIGADYAFRPGFVVGVLAQFDRTDEVDDTYGFSIEGDGWLVGPYVVARLRSNLIFDARVAWGKSDNQVSPYNTYTDDFEGRRWLARSRLTGDFNFGRLHVAPHVGVVYFEEEQKAYTDSVGNVVGAQTVALGRVTFGPKFSTTFTRKDGATITPHVGIDGIWDFKRNDIVDVDTGIAVSGSDDLRARVQAGVTARRADGGLSLTAEGFYDGIGARDFDAYGGTLRMDMKF